MHSAVAQNTVVQSLRQQSLQWLQVQGSLNVFVYHACSSGLGGCRDDQGHWAPMHCEEHSRQAEQTCLQMQSS